MRGPYAAFRSGERGTIPAPVRIEKELTMELHETKIQMDDEQNSVVAKAMVSVVAIMALMVIATVLVFSAGGTIV